MKKINELEKKIKRLEEEIFCHKIGDDFYYTSPLCQHHQQALRILNAQKNALVNKKMQKNKNYTGQA